MADTTTFGRMIAPVLFDLEEAERSIESAAMLLAGQITAQPQTGGSEDVALLGIVELLDMNRDRLRGSRALIERLREEVAQTGAK